MAKPPSANGTTQVTTLRYPETRQRRGVNAPRKPRSRALSLDVLSKESSDFGHQVRELSPLDKNRRADRQLDALARIHHATTPRQHVDRAFDRDRHDRRAGVRREVKPTLLQLSDR